jgi:hypothetical protein
MKKKSVIQVDACEISHLIEEEYGFEEFNIPYAIMEGRNMIEVGIISQQIDPNLILEFNEKGYSVACGMTNMMESLLNDLCFQGKLEAGNYILEFDD